MANKLRDIFKKNDHFLKGTIRFKDEATSEAFRKALEIVYREGKTVPVSGIDSMTMGVESGSGFLPIEKAEGVTDVIVGPSGEELNLEIEVDGEKIDFHVIRYSLKRGCKVVTKEDFVFETQLTFDEDTQTAKVNFKPVINRAETVDEVLRGIRIEKAFLEKFFSGDLEKETGLDLAMRHLDELYTLFDRIRFLEEAFQKKFTPASIDLNDVESQKDLFEICLLIRDKKALRFNAKMSDATGKGIRLATPDTVIENQEISMTFFSDNEYSVWGENIKIYCANFMGNAIVKTVEPLDDGQIRLIYTEEESRPMYISYKGFKDKDEAHAELDTLMDHREEYVEALTIDQYLME